jgi:two-component system response regulator VanR
MLQGNRGERVRTILIIEDDEKLAIALAVRLKASGYQVFVAYDALSGVCQAVKREPDLILLDIAMPLGGGWSVAERIKSMANMAAIPIVFMTALKEPGLREKALGKYGAAGFLEKPFEASALISMIHAALDDSTGVSSRVFMGSTGR